MPLHRHLPHLRPVSLQPIVFLTVVTSGRRRSLNCDAAMTVLEEIWQRSPAIDGWAVGDYLLMPDHVHLFARAALDAKPLANWVGTWKSLSARRLQPTAGPGGPFWQADYFDRYLRSAESYGEKWHYVTENPVRQGLCESAEQWPWRGRLFDLQF